MVTKECLWKQLTDVVWWLEYMESPLIVYASLLTEFMGTKCNIYIHRTEPNRTNLYWTNIIKICNNKSIQHNSTESLGPHEDWTAITGTPVKWVGNQWKTKGLSNRKPHRNSGISSWQNDNTMCHQRRGSCQSDDPLPSVINNAFKLDWVHENVWIL